MIKKEKEDNQLLPIIQVLIVFLGWLIPLIVFQYYAKSYQESMRLMLMAMSLPLSIEIALLVEIFLKFLKRVTYSLFNAPNARVYRPAPEELEK